VERIRTFYAPILKRLYDNPDARTNDLEHLAQIASRYKSRKRFLTELILDPPSSTGDLAGPGTRDEDWLVLSTIHSAKGCEWDAVYLIHAADGCLPSDMATGDDEEIEEELRLTYVAMTRARDYLYVLWPLRFYHHGSRFTDEHTYAQCSRFFSAKVLETMESVSTGEVQQDTDAPFETDTPKDISSQLKNMWE
jgi:DNA helicase-2/ATP-dependent DNA helicase PcrA